MLWFGFCVNLRWSVEAVKLFTVGERKMVDSKMLRYQIKALPGQATPA